MIYLMFADQSYAEVPLASSATVESDQVLCYDNLGQLVATYEASLVTAYGSNEALREPSEESPPIEFLARRPAVGARVMHEYAGAYRAG